MKLDLHLHTRYSDGRQTPAELASSLAAAGVTHAAVTDHDTLASFAEVEEACAQHGIRTVSGVEISTSFRGHPLHILAYGVNPTNSGLIEFLQGINAFRRSRFLELVPNVNEWLAADGRPPLAVAKLAAKSTNYFSKPGIARILVEEGIVNSIEEGFSYSNRLTGTIPRVSPPEAIAATHAAGGKAVLAHPLAPRLSLREVTDDETEWERVIKSFRDSGLDGLEVYTPAHDPESVRRAHQMATLSGLIMSAGSDWHGPLEIVGKGILAFIPHYGSAPGPVLPPAGVQNIARALGL